jgi:hypothetical protein
MAVNYKMTLGWAPTGPTFIGDIAGIPAPIGWWGMRPFKTSGVGAASFTYQNNANAGPLTTVHTTSTGINTSEIIPPSTWWIQTIFDQSVTTGQKNLVRTGNNFWTDIGWNSMYVFWNYDGNTGAVLQTPLAIPQPFTMSMIVKNTRAAAESPWIGGTSGGVGLSGIFDRFNSAGNHLWRTSVGDSPTSWGTAGTDTTMNAIQFVFNGASSKYKINNGALTNFDVNGTDGLISGWGIGAIPTLGGAPIYWLELGLWSGDQSAYFTQIYSNQIAFYPAIGT